MSSSATTIPSSHFSPLIIAPSLNNSIFVDTFAFHLLKQVDTKLNILISPIATTDDQVGLAIPQKLHNFVDQGRLHIWFGSAGNGRLVRQIVESKHISVVYLLLSADPCDSAKAGDDGDIVQRTRRFLTELCSLLDTGIRQCAEPPTLVVVARAAESDDTFPLGASTNDEGNVAMDGSGKGTSRPASSSPSSPSSSSVLCPAVGQCRNEKGARFASAHALLHSFAVSYRLNVQIAALLVGQGQGGQQQHLTGANDTKPTLGAMDFLVELAKKQGGKAQIHQYREGGNEHSGACEENGNSRQCEQIANNDNAGDHCVSPSIGKIPIGRLLLFGCSVDSAITKRAMAEAKAFVPTVMAAESRPGLDTDEAVEREILDKAPSHVGFIGDADEQTMAGWEAGGCAQLRENVRHNLFSPWLLRHICTKFGLRFICLTSDAMNDKSHPRRVVEQPTEAESRQQVVRQFAERLAQL